MIMVSIILQLGYVKYIIKIPVLSLWINLH